MNTFKNNLPALLLVGMGFFASSAQASLEVRPGGMVYDTDLNITWLADANLAASNTFGISISISNANGPGTMTWDQAQSWVSAMNTANYHGYNDWRLPTADPACGLNYDCTDSEMGHLYYQELGATSALANPSIYGILTGNPTELAKFSNVQADAYWLDTEYEPDTNFAWFFGAHSGGQNWGVKPTTIPVWAVRSGDVAAVPLPAAVWLFGSALTGLTLLGAKRRRG